MSKRATGLLLALTLFSGLGVATRSFGADTTTTRHRTNAQFSDSLPEHTTIRLVTGAFDPLRGVPSVPSALRATHAGHWLVQVQYPATKATRTAIVAKGAHIVAQLPDVTYIVRATPATAASLRTIEGVRWVGAYEPAYKLSPFLTDVGGTPARLRVWPYFDGSGTALAPKLVGIPGVTVVRADRWVVMVDAPASALAALARVDGVQYIEHAPKYALHNANALWTTDTGERDILAAGAHLDGSGQTAADADTGINYVPDPDGLAQQAFSDCNLAHPNEGCKLADYVQKDIGNDSDQLATVTPTGTHHRKMAGYFNLTDDPIARSQEASWHGTHTAGSIAADYPDGSGRYGTRSREADGIAAGARLVFQDVESGGGLRGLPGSPYDLFDQVYDLNHNGKYDPLEDARTHNNSYGAIFPEFDDGGAEEADRFVVDHPDMVIGFSAANDGPDAATLAGGPQESKNVITSCASANGRQPLVSPDAVASFSSHGPTLDGRIKPDVCTPGQIVVSPKGGTTDADQYLQGTSMSDPVLIGLATLVRQYYWDGFATASGTGFAAGNRDFSRRHNPSAALVKATIINSSQRMRGTYSGDDGKYESMNGQWPSAGQGWGKVQLDSSLFFTGDDRALFTVDRPNDVTSGLETDDTVTENLDVAPGQPLDVTLVWTDPESALGAGSPALINDLNLVVTGPDGVQYLGNDFTTESPVVGPGGNANADVNESRPNGSTPDFRNNVEGVRIANPKPGRWKISVSGNNVLAGPQGYSLVASGRIATDTPRIVSGAPKYHSGTTATAYLLGSQLNGDVPGFERLAPGVYRVVQTAAAPSLTVSGGGTSLTIPVDDTPPAVSNANVESVSADLARVTWTTDENSTGEVVVTGPDGVATSYPDVYNVSGFKGLATPQVETQGVYLNRKVNGTKHEVSVTGLRPGVEYSYAIRNMDEAGNVGDGATGTFTSTDAIYAPNATDQAMLLSGETSTGLPTTDAPHVSDPVGLPSPPVVGIPQTGQSWGTNTQFYAGAFSTTVDTAGGIVGANTPLSTVKAVPAFMFRLPKSLDPSRITGAAVEMYSAHDIVDPYNDRPVYQLDLLNSSIESSWGPGETYRAVDSTPADVHMITEPTLRRGANTPYVFSVACNNIDAFRKNLSGDSGNERDAAFRLRGVTDQNESLFSFEFGFGRRSRGPQLRPRLILFLDGKDPMPCQATAAPKISDVEVDHSTDTSAIVSWRTDVPADSTVYYRLAGTSDWTPVSAPVRVTQHFIRVDGLTKNGSYEFLVRSATCNGLASTDDNHGALYALYNEAFSPPQISGVFAHASASSAKNETVGWATDQVSSTVVRYGVAPDNLDKSVSTDSVSKTSPTASHRAELTGLNPCTRYYFRVESTNGNGKTAISPVYAFDRSPATITPTTTFNFDSGDQGWRSDSGSGTLSDPVTATALVDNPTVWKRQAEPEFNDSQSFRTVFQRTGTPGYSSNTDVRLVSPPITVPATAPALQWGEWYDLEGAQDVTVPFDEPRVEISLDDGKSWIGVRTGPASQNPDFPDPTTVSVQLPDAAKGKSIRIAFHLKSDAAVEGQGGWAVDNVIVGTNACPQLAAASAAVALAPESPPAAAQPSPSGIRGPIPPVRASGAAIGALPSLDPVAPDAAKSGTCRCAPVSYQAASGSTVVISPAPIRITPQVRGARTGRLPATGGGLLALPALGLLGSAGGIRRLTRRRRCPGTVECLRS